METITFSATFMFPRRTTRNMKTYKEIQLAAQDFIRAFQSKDTSKFNGTFIPFDIGKLYKKQQLYLAATLLCLFIFLYLLYNALFIDAIYYWHIDFPVILGFITISIFVSLSARFAWRYYFFNKTIQSLLSNPEQRIYGTLITDQYYFEYTPDNYHIIARENIIRIDYAETRNDGQHYLEILLDMEKHIENRGLLYKAEEYDLKAWIENR